MMPFDCLDKAPVPPPVDPNSSEKWREAQLYKADSELTTALQIAKAPRDFPNDLLHEFEAYRFEVSDWPLPDGSTRWIGGIKGRPEGGLTLIVFTSNGERLLPDAFLRRCVHHHLRFDPDWLASI